MISIECAECFKSYKVKPEMAGKRAKCKCGALIQIPGGQRKKREQAATAAPQRRKPARKPQPQRDPWDDDPHPDDDFGDDFGDDFAHDDHYDEPPRRPRRSKSGAGSRNSRGRSSKRGRKKRGGTTSSPMKIAGLIFLGVAVVGMLLGLFLKPVGIATGGIVMIVCGAFMVVGGLRCMIAAFQEDVTCGLLWLFVPFYSLYYIISRFSELSEYLMLWFGGLIGAMICGGYISLLGNM